MSAMEWPFPLPPEYEGSLSGPMTLDKAVGLPALLGCLFRLGEGVALLPQIVYENRQRRERATDSDQWRLLHERPNGDTSPGVFRGDLAFGIAGAGEAFVRKYKVRGGTKVKELVAMDATKITPRRQGGRVVFEDRSDGQVVTRNAREIIHIRGITVPGGVRGISRITAARVAIATGLKRQSWIGAYYDNNGEPRVMLSFPENMPHDVAEKWVTLWDADHAGEGNWHRTGAIGGGATVTTLPVSLKDAEFVESTRMTAEQCAGLFAIPLPFLSIPREGSDSGLSEADRMQLVTFALGPIYVAIDEAFNRDEDLFPRDSGLFTEHLADALLRPDTKSRYEAYKAARQAGWLTANEIRALENYPAREEGDELQATPVGGAPNDRRRSSELDEGSNADEAGHSGALVEKLGGLAESLGRLAERPLELHNHVDVDAELGPVQLEANLGGVELNANLHTGPRGPLVVRRQDGSETRYEAETEE